jgi:hypothetical protein
VYNTSSCIPEKTCSSLAHRPESRAELTRLWFAIDNFLINGKSKAFVFDRLIKSNCKLVVIEQMAKGIIYSSLMILIFMQPQKGMNKSYPYTELWKICPWCKWQILLSFSLILFLTTTPNQGPFLTNYTFIRKVTPTPWNLNVAWVLSFVLRIYLRPTKFFKILIFPRIVMFKSHWI